MSEEYRVRDMAAAAFIVARNLPFPSVVQERGRNVFVFQDVDGAVRQAHEEFVLDDPFDGTPDGTAQISARRLFIAWRELRNALPPREEGRR